MVAKENKLEQDLLKRDKTELITIIKLMLQQRPELSWVLRTPQPEMGKRVLSADANLYLQQIETAVAAAAEHYRDRAYREALSNTLATIQTVADGFAQKANYLAALAIYEVLVEEAIEHYFTIDTGYLIFTPALFHCVDGLDSCVAEAGKNQEMRLRAFKGLFAIYRFSLGSSTDLGEDIPDLLVGNTTREERQILADWVRYELSQLTSNARSNASEYNQLLRRLEKEDIAAEILT